jgi:putative methyltransferase (TIGR04325 family)
VLDIGGSVGVHYYAYQNYVSCPDDLEWVVAEISSVAAAGRALARRKDEHRIRFIETLDVNEPGADIWLSCGAIHYIEDARPDTLLQRARKKPVHFILNKLPLYAGEDYVCTQNIGDGCFAPLHVYSRDKLIADIESNGYALVDAWNVPGRSHYVPGHPDKSFDQYSGLYFRRK